MEARRPTGPGFRPCGVLIADAEPGALSGWLGTDAAEIAQIAPELRERVGGLPEPPSAALAQPEKARFRLFDSVASFVRRAAETQPLLIILDDLHAADPTSLMMLVAVSRQIRTMRATIVGTYREIEVKHLPELAALITEAEREGLVLPLRGLGEADIGEFVERTWGVRAASSLVDLLRDMTEGNPFFLHEVLRQMAADGQLAGGAPGEARFAQHPARRQRIHQAADAAAAGRGASDARRRLRARARVLPQRACGRDGQAARRPDRPSRSRRRA